MFVFKQIPQDLDSFEGDLIIAIVGEDERPLKAANSWLDWRLYGLITELIVQGRFSGKLGEKCLMPTYGKFKFDRLVLVGGGILFEDVVYPSESGGIQRWNEIADWIEKTIQPLRVDRVGLSLPRFDLIDHERALLKTLQASRLPSNTSLFLSRMSQNTGAALL